jgi:uncharacterized protein
MAEELFEFGDEEFQVLADWLTRRGKGIFDISTLEGFLTALVIGPNTVSPSVWMPKVWGTANPKFKSQDELNLFTALVMSYFNDLVEWFEQEPENFEPSFYEREVRGKTILVVDEWCFGFLKGMRLDRDGWKPLVNERPDLLKPLQLFGTPSGWRELEAGGEVKMHALWSPRIAPAVREIHRYWLPHRALSAAPVPGQRLH